MMSSYPGHSAGCCHKPGIRDRALFDRTHFVLFEQMNFLVCVHHLQAEVIFVQSNAFDRFPSGIVTGYGSYS